MWKRSLSGEEARRGRATARLEFVVQRLQFGQFGVAGALGHHAGGIAFQQREQVVDLGQVAAPTPR